MTVDQDDTTKQLEKRIQALESTFHSAKVYSGAITLALLILLGLSWRDIPRKAAEVVEGEAVKQAEIAATKAASQAKDSATQAEESARDAIRHAQSAEKSYEVANDIPQQVAETTALVLGLSEMKPLSRCKLQNEAIWGTCAPPSQEGNRMPALETSLTPVGGGWSDWSPWQVASEWNGAPHSCIRFRLFCEGSDTGTE